MTYPATVSVHFKQGLLTLAIIEWTLGEKEAIAKAMALRQEILGIYAPALVVADSLKDGAPSSAGFLRLRDVQGNELVMTPTALGQLMLVFTAGGEKLPGGS